MLDTGTNQGDTVNTVIMVLAYGVPFILLFFGGFVGTILERRHLKSIREREAATGNLPAVPTRTLDSGPTVVESIPTLLDTSESINLSSFRLLDVLFAEIVFKPEKAPALALTPADKLLPADTPADIPAERSSPPLIPALRPLPTSRPIPAEAKPDGAFNEIELSSSTEPPWEKRILSMPLLLAIALAAPGLPALVASSVINITLVGSARRTKEGSSMWYSTSQFP